MPPDSTEGKWPFDQGPNVAAITTTHVTSKKHPILLVTHYADDDSWGFLSGLPFSMEDSQLVAMKTIMRIDSSVAEVADLAPGWSAQRSGIGEEWIRFENEEENGE